MMVEKNRKMLQINQNIYNLLNKNTNYLFILLLISLITPSFSLYEDQIGKFDWKQSFVGKVKDAYFDGSSDRVIVTTEENVLAALSGRTGHVLWRKILEKSTRGEIRLLHVQNNANDLMPLSGGGGGGDIITISGTSPALIRGWNPSSGNIEWEWTLTSNSLTGAENAIWFYNNLYIYHVLPIYNSHLEVTAYFGSTGQQIKPTSTRISAAWIKEESCVLAAPFYACVIKNQIIAVDLSSDTNELVTKVLDRDFSGATPTLLRGAEATIVVDDLIVSLKNEEPIKSKSSAIMFNDKYSSTQKNVLVTASLKNRLIEVNGQYLESADEYKDLHFTAQFDRSLGTPEIFDVRCKSKSQSKQECRVLLATDNGAIVLLQQSAIKWVREEALTKIVAIEMIDLPLSDSEGSIENELKNKDGNIFGALKRRIISQIFTVKNLLLTVIGLSPPLSATQKAGLERDAFGLHKMIIAATQYGKIFGIDNISGKQHWEIHLPNFSGFNNQQNMQILVQRTARHFPYTPQCILIAKNKQTQQGILYQFNPITGEPINGGLVELNFEIKQLSLLHEADEHFFKPVLLFDQQNVAHVVPESAAKSAHATYLFTADKNTGIATGFYIKYADQKLSTLPIWQLNLGGLGNTQKIINIAGKNPNEHVHSQGRVLNDRSVLYKYINPNLVAIATQGPDATHKYVLNVHLIDVVSGAIVSSLTHKRVKGPINILHSENWLVYTYYNEKVRRTELTTIELYEGKTQANSTVWSSLDAPQLPMVEKQSYIIPANVVALRETITEKGITNKHVLIGLSSGSIIEMPWALLDPRRPILLPNQPREEGVIPYIPELQLPSENVINYNQSVLNIQGIYTAPSGLESTCLVIAYGLDFFVTRVAPSKTFDLLKEDFDYLLITAVLGGLTIASIVVKHFSSRKAIKQAWK